MLRMRRATTLVELIISIFLMFIIIYAITNFRMLAVSRVLKLDQQLRLQNMLSIAAGDITKNILRSTGDISSDANHAVRYIAVSSINTLRIKIDDHSLSAQTPGDHTDDYYYDYYLSGCSLMKHVLDYSGSEVIAPESIASGITYFNVTIREHHLGALIYLQARKNCAAARDIKNSEVSTTFEAYSRAASAN